VTARLGSFLGDIEAPLLPSKHPHRERTEFSLNAEHRISRRTMFPILPWELVSAIIQHVIERSTLITLCLTTKAAYSEASKRIYRDLSDNLDRNPAHHLHRIKALIAYPRLASLVRSFSIKSVASSWRYTPPNNGLETEDEALVKKGRKVDLKGEIWGILPQALNLMSNLEHLSFREFSGQPSAHWLLPNVTFQLKTLRWGSHGEGEPMAAFLETQQRLETLHLEEGLSCPMDPGSCLTLKSVQGNLSTFQRFLPGRPGIKHLRWVPSMEEYDGDPLINILVEELGRITHFSIGGYFMRRLLSVFGGHFRDLIALEIYYIYEVRNSYELEHSPDIAISARNTCRFRNSEASSPGNFEPGHRGRSWRPGLCLPAAIRRDTPTSQCFYKSGGTSDKGSVAKTLSMVEAIPDGDSNRCTVDKVLVKD